MIVSLVLAAWFDGAWLKGLNFGHAHGAREKPARIKVHSDKIKQKVYGQNGWVMTIQTDGFTGKVRCRLVFPKTLFQGRITYAQKTLGFELGESENTLKAWYRIGNQPAKPWQDLYPALVGEKVPLGRGSLENPTNGVVLIPIEEIGNAQLVSIRVDENSPVKRFKLSGFTKSLAVAKVNGCAVDENFERDKW